MSRLISIHALRKESDVPHTVFGAPAFNISIHALRKESDARAVGIGRYMGYFNPRSP